MNLRGAKAVIDLLNERMPPIVAKRHCITVIEGMLTLVVYVRSDWRLITLSEEDLDKEPSKVIDDVVAALQAAIGEKKDGDQRDAAQRTDRTRQARRADRRPRTVQSRR